MIRPRNRAAPALASSQSRGRGDTILVPRTADVAVTRQGHWAAMGAPQGRRGGLDLEGGVDLELGSEVGAPRRPPRYAAELRAGQRNGPLGPSVLTTSGGGRVPRDGPHRSLLATDRRSVAVGEQGGGDRDDPGDRSATEAGRPRMPRRGSRRDQAPVRPSWRVPSAA
jgi:hypothetical protein